ncbi:MAG: dihydroxyacetone kinase subunit DhaK [Geminicoccaceae bacterium]|nr:dihydroxyacetone kinase subunit DhaK [Geminicoccaceae bacterium]
MTSKTKKIMNDPARIVPEMVEGICAAYPRHVMVHPENEYVLLSRHLPKEGQVGVLIGGGSGHEPAFAGYVGRGMAHAAALGEVFTSPTPEPILLATQAIHSGNGVLYLYNNYAGDCLNFDMAAEMAQGEGIEVRTVLGIDDIASAREPGNRRGIAGGFFLFKCAGAAAGRGDDLDRVEALTRKAVAAMRSMGVALGACSLPAVLTPGFELGDDDMEIGMGIHGEAGVRRGPLEPADAIVDAMLDRILGELPLGRGDCCAVLVNGLGATSTIEQYVAARRVHRRLADRGVAVHKTHVGEYVTSLEMAGLSVTLMQLDGELIELLDAPADACMYRQP